MKQATLLAALASLGIAGAAQAACDVSLAATHANGQVVLLADCATAITNILWKRDGADLGTAITPTDATGTKAYLTTTVPSGTHSYTATANTGAVVAGQPATITAPPATLTVVATEGGTITSAPAGINACTNTGGANCTADLATGTAVTLTAAQDSSHSWGGWGGDCSGTAVVCALSMTGPKLVTANFGPQPTPGACGTPVPAPSATPPSSGLCSAGSAGAVTTNPTTYTWTCSGVFGSTSNASCSSTRIVNGACGSSSGTTPLSSAPTGTGACETGTIFSLAQTSSAPFNYTWGCQGSGTGGTSTSATACSAPMASVNGECGTPPASATQPNSGLCTKGNPTSVTPNADTYSWVCNGQADGTPSGTCTSPRIINGVCGSANGVAVATAPSSGLCNAGTPSAVSGTGPFTWTCADINDSTPANCSAPLLAAGSCPAAPGNYTVRDSYDTSGTEYDSSSYTLTLLIPAGQGVALPFTINKSAYPFGYKVTDAVGGSKSYKISKCPGATDGLVDAQNGTISVNGDAKNDNCGILNMYVRYKETSGVSASYYNNATNLSLQTSCFLPTTTALGSSTPAVYYLNILNTGTSQVSTQLKNLPQIN